MTKHIFAGCIFLLLYASACKKPPQQQNPTSIIECKVNGKDFKASADQNFYSTRYQDIGPKAGFYEDDFTIGIFGLQIDGTDTTLLDIKFDRKPGTIGIYPISYVEDAEVLAFYYSNLEDYDAENTQIYFDGKGTGTLEITDYDSAKGTLSGNFHFDLIPNAANSSLPSYKISDGKITGLRRYD